MRILKRNVVTGANLPEEASDRRQKQRIQEGIMTHKKSKLGLGIVAILAFAAVEATAWGPNAERGISGTALQVIRQTYSSAFKGMDDKTFDDDLIRGATEGYSLLFSSKRFSTEQDINSTIENELGLLREIRKYGMGSYFAYRMGALGTFSADLLLPFYQDSSPELRDIRQRMETDIDNHFERYNFQSSMEPLQYVRSASRYFQKRHSLLLTNARIIADDYTKGVGYEGYMQQAGPVYFQRAVSITADIWNTVLRTEGDTATPTPSKEAEVTYLVNEIKYLLEVKKNFVQATKVYDIFDRLAKGQMPEAYENVGDLFADFGTEKSADRAVREWRVAYEAQASNRRRVGGKIAEHYINLGEKLMNKALLPTATEDDLPNALNAFTQALEYDQTNKLAAEKMNAANTAIAERKQRREMNVKLIASAEKVLVQAEKSRLGGDYGNAMATYNQALGLYQAVDEGFADQLAEARDKSKRIAKSLSDIVNEILDKASSAVDRGDKALTEHNFEAAIAAYDEVTGTLAMLPPDDKRAKDKNQLIETAKKKKGDVPAAKERWEREQKAKEEEAKRAAAAGGGGGAAPSRRGAAQ